MPKMSVSFINPFLASTMNLFTEMFQITPEMGKPFVLDLLGNHRWEISGVIGLTGQANGIVVIRLPHMLSTKLLEKSGVEVPQDPQELEQIINEMVGEFVNIIAGNALSQLGHLKIDVSPPFTIQGHNHSIAWPTKLGPIISIPFHTKHGPFEVDVCFKEMDVPRGKVIQ